MNLDLEGRVALVTGSSQGIGSATAIQFAAEGAYVAVTYRQERELAEAIVNEIRSNDGEAFAVHLDLASFESITLARDAVVNKWGQIDILVNNAIEWGPRRIAQSPPFEDLAPEEWQPLLRANIEGTFRLIQTVVPCMREHRWGRIANVSSIAAEDGLPGTGWYSTAKASLHGLTRTLSKELGPAGILVNAVMPGLTETGRTADIGPEARRRVEENSPIRRILHPGDVAHVIVFLCSATNTAITGEILRASGGRI
jgi:3-oxoacyl-[acyl-carrier protein] reductase